MMYKLLNGQGGIWLIGMVKTPRAAGSYNQKTSSIVILTLPLLLLYTAKKVVHNSCNTGTCDLPDNVCTCACVITIKLVQHVIRTTI